MTHEEKAELIKEYASKYNADTLIETGTYYGDMVESQKDVFKNIYSVELGEELSNNAKERFKGYSHIQVIQGDSAVILKTLDSVFTGNCCVVFLDAHHSGNDTVGDPDNDPMLTEVAVLSANKNNVIIIDDIHGKVADVERLLLGMLFTYLPGVMVCEPRKIANVNFSITTACNRKCKNCSYGAHYKRIKHMTVGDIAEAAIYFQDCDVTITGGEPTIHPLFQELAPSFSQIFGRPVSIETNGYGFDKFPHLFRYFKNIHVTNYITGDYFSQKEDNTDIINGFIKENPDLKIYVNKMFSHKDRHVFGKNICPIGSSVTVGYFDGKIYPCCIGNGFVGAVGIEPTEGWMDIIRNTPFNCNHCFFSV
jgi:hypothetical protein